MWDKSWCTDEFGNINTNLIGKRVKDDLAEFYVENFTMSGVNWWLHMDPTKPYVILNPMNPMKVCVESGHYSVMAICCRQCEVA